MALMAIGSMALCASILLLQKYRAGRAEDAARRFEIDSGGVHDELMSLEALPTQPGSEDHRPRLVEFERSLEPLFESRLGTSSEVAAIKTRVARLRDLMSGTPGS